MINDENTFLFYSHCTTQYSDYDTTWIKGELGKIRCSLDNLPEPASVPTNVHNAQPELALASAVMTVLNVKPRYQKTNHRPLRVN